MATAKEVLGRLRPYLEQDNLFNRINRFKRQFYIAVQEKAISHLAKLARLYPEPERHLVRKPNSHVWLDIFDEYLELEGDGRIYGMVKDIRRAFIGKIETENNYSERVDVLVETIARKYNEGEFRKRKPWTPTNGWKDPETIKEQNKIKMGLMEELKKDLEEIKV